MVGHLPLKEVILVRIQASQLCGGIFIAGVNPNAALLQTIKVLKANISTGIGTAISIQYLKNRI